jgi:apolipoprotein N-acyltransferase
MLRATNTGMTAMVNPDGRITAALAPFATSALVVQAQGRSGLTPYARWGNLLALLIAFAACLPAARHKR